MINYTEKIPNNVDLGRDRILQRALEHWQPAYMGWWYDMGPNESHNYEVYLRTAISVEPDGWAQFGYVKMPEYRWGIFLQPRDEKREVNFGIHKGQAAWQEVPGECRRRASLVGHGVFAPPLLWPRWTRRGRVLARSSLRRRRQSAHSWRVQ